MRTLEPFTSGPLEGARVAPDVYVVTSYGQPIGAAIGAARLITVAHISATTGRQTGQLRAAWMGSYTDVEQSTLEAAVTVRS